MKFFIIATLIITICSTESYDMKTNKISDQYLQKFTEITKNYIHSTRSWTDSEYVIKFYYIETEKNIAILSATHNSVFDMINEKIKKDGYIKEQGRYPELEVDIVIDLIDFVVLSENEIGTKYPNAGKKLPYCIMK